MKVFLFALLLVAVKVVDSQVLVAYKPAVTQANIVGKVTATTITLDQPRCVFHAANSGSVQPGYIFWLVVANGQGGRNRFDGEVTNYVNTAALTYKLVGTNEYYLTLHTLEDQYNCSITGATAVVRVGEETTCTTSNCNTPLDNSKSYSMKFILINPSISINNPNVIAQSEWSDSIRLKQLAVPGEIDPSPAGRSAGMIVITTILSILLFLLLALLVALLAMHCCRSTGKTDISEPVPKWGSLRRYTTHNLKDTNIGPYAQRI